MVCVASRFQKAAIVVLARDPLLLVPCPALRPNANGSKAAPIIGINHLEKRKQDDATRKARVLCVPVVYRDSARRFLCASDTHITSLYLVSILPQKEKRMCFVTRLDGGSGVNTSIWPRIRAGQGQVFSQIHPETTKYRTMVYSSQASFFHGFFLACVQEAGR